MKKSQRQVVEFYKNTVGKFNVYSFKNGFRESAYIKCDMIDALTEAMNKTHQGCQVLFLTDEGELAASEYERKNPGHRVSFEFCSQYSVGIYSTGNLHTSKF